MTLNWLRVERAIIFFKSHSNIAETPAISMVKALTIIRNWLNHWNDIKREWNRINRKTPAVTKVEECTRADTGVGAAMAAGSHEEKGI